MSITFEVPGGTGPGSGEGADVLCGEEFAELYLLHRDALRRYCRRKVGDSGLVDDIVQDVFERAFVRRTAYDRSRQFWPWLASIAARACIDAHRRVVSAQGREDRYTQSMHREPTDETSGEVLRAFERSRLAREMAALPLRQRMALGLFAIDGWTYEQIAQHLGQSTEAVKGLIRRARATLRESTGRWVVGLVQGGRLATARLRRRIGQMIAWPQVSSMADPCAGAMAGSVALLAVGVLGGMLPAGPASAAPPPPAPRAATGWANPAGRAPGDTGSALPAAGREASAPSRERGPGPVDMGEHVVGTPLVISPAGDDPESIQVHSFATSPQYEEDPAVFAVGEPVSARGRTPLLVSHDDGRSWQARRALGLAPVTKLLLPPAYPRDNRLFALTGAGIQVSRDEGDTFETVLPLPLITDVALSPGFDSGDPAMLVVAGERLWRYDDATDALSPVEVAGPPAAHRITSVAYDARERAPVVMLGSREPNLPFGAPDLHVSRCTTAGGLVGGPRLACQSTRLPFVPALPLSLGVSPHFRSGLLYVPFRSFPVVLVSADGGRTFSTALDGLHPGEMFSVWDLAAAPSRSGMSAVVAQQSFGGSTETGARRAQLARTDDGGSTWVPMVVDLPEFEFARAVAVTPTGRVIVGSGTRGLACSADGRTWGRTCA